jgi:hypothetical protein
MQPSTKRIHAAETFVDPIRRLEQRLVVLGRQVERLEYELQVALKRLSQARNERTPEAE